MKNIYIMLSFVFLLFISCEDIVKSDSNINKKPIVSNDDKNDIIDGNSNEWLEINDLQNIEVCMAGFIYNELPNGLLITTEIEYETYYLESLQDDLFRAQIIRNQIDCPINYEPSGIDFDNKDLFLLSQQFEYGTYLGQVKLYKNEDLKKYLLLIEVLTNVVSTGNEVVNHKLLFPNIPQDYTFSIDTLLTIK